MKVGITGFAQLALLLAILIGCSSDPIDDLTAPVVEIERNDEIKTAAEVPSDEEAPRGGVSMATVDEIQEFLSAHTNEVLVINFWATWCAPCVHEMPELAAFYEAYEDRGVAFLSLSSDSADDYEAKLVPFVEERDLPFHVFAIANIDPDVLDQQLNVGMDFALPTTFVFDRERNEVKKWMRNITQADLERAVHPLIALPE